jgi:hypothetical protein
MSFDRLYDEMVHDEFRPAQKAAASKRGAHAAPPPSRARTITMVASGGVACAVVGALLGGLGGEFGVSPATAHAIGTTHYVPLAGTSGVAFIERAPVAGHHANATGRRVSHNGVAATFASLGAALGAITPGEAVPVATSVGATGTGGTGIGGTDPTGTNPTGTAPGGASDPISGLVGSLDDVVAGLTSALDGLGSLLPLPALPGTVTVPVVTTAAPAAGGGASSASLAAPAGTTAPVKIATPVKLAAPAKTTAPVKAATSAGTSAPASSGSTSASTGSVPTSTSTGTILSTPTTVISTATGVVSSVPTTTVLPSDPSLPVPLPTSTATGTTTVTGGVPSL